LTSKFRTSAVALGIVASCSLTGVAVAAPPAGEIEQSQGLRKALTVEGIGQHLSAFQAHSDFGGGTRAAGSPGYNASADYVKAKAAAAGYTTSEHTFSFSYNADRTPPTMKQVAPAATEYVDGVDFQSMTFSGTAPETTATLWAVDLQLPKAPGPGLTTSGCQAEDFTGMPAGAIALMQRGDCGFGAKANNARAAGAAGAIIFNDGGDASRTGVVNGTLGTATPATALGTSLAIGVDLANDVSSGDTGSVVTYKVDRVTEQRTTRNIIAESAGGDPNNVVVVGAHLDSVPRGAGINDNGSGSGGILEIAETLSERRISTRNKVRFMWYSAEEFGLLGSRAYVNDLPAAERKKVKAMLNFDMIGSPNYVRFVYDGDNSAFPVGPGAAKGPQGSGEIERVFHDYFTSQGLPSDETPFSGRSDYGPFIADGVDIPAGGLFTGAEGLKTAEQAAVYGGEAGVAYDGCYHLRCDDLTNINTKGLGEMADAAGHATMTMAKRDFAKNPLINPSTPVSGTGGTTDAGGGLHPPHEHDHEEGDAE
jgi:Zn-dependent M28 family amino/carboxypeptidase